MKPIFLLILAVAFSFTALAKKDKVVPFTFYGSKWSVRISDNLKSAKLDTTDIVAFDSLKIATLLQCTLDDCMALKKEKRLNDWAYLCMLDSVSSACLGKGSKTTIMKGFLFSLSGYKVKFAIDDKREIHFLFGSKNFIYNYTYFSIDGEYYYIENHISSSMRIKTFKTTGKSLSLDMRELPLLDLKKSKPRTIKTAIKQPPLSVTVSVNLNLMHFFSQYPSSMKNYDFMTRWSMMANTPLDDYVKQQIYPVLKKQLEGLSQLDAAQRLLWWIHGHIDLEKNNPDQNCFLYAYDDDVWGHDRAFYAEETLFYPYCDDEDRVILLSRLIRDLLGLEVVILYFPGHLSLAIHFDEEVEGASVIYNSDRFVVADPTYIGSKIGEAMPTFDNEDPERMILLYK